jgi:YbbR domain-containing protein
LVFLSFVALASCFWLLQYFQQKIERDISIPIYYTQVPDEIVLTDSLPDKMTIRLEDKGTVFLRYLFDENFTAIHINLKDISLDKNTYTVDRSVLNSQIQDFLLNTTQLVSFKPEVIRIHYSPLKRKEVPVKIEGKITTAAGYMFVDSLHISPSKVWVYGDQGALDTLQFVKTGIAKEENIQKNLDLTLALNVPRGLRLSVEKVRITSEVEEYTEKKFELPVVCRNLPENVQIRFFPSTVEVICQLALSKYPHLTESALEVQVDYNALSQSPGMNVPLELSRKPQWLLNYRIVPETVEYLIE